MSDGFLSTRTPVSNLPVGAYPAAGVGHVASAKAEDKEQAALVVQSAPRRSHPCVIARLPQGGPCTGVGACTCEAARRGRDVCI